MVTNIIIKYILFIKYFKQGKNYKNDRYIFRELSSYIYIYIVIQGGQHSFKDQKGEGLRGGGESYV